MITRRAFTAALSLTGLAALAGLSPLRLIADAMAQSASDVAKPVSLPDMALGPANATVTITEYASMTCPHCAAFNETVFPKIKSEYIDSGKVRYVFREFPLDIKAAAGSMLARCIAKDDAGKYFAVIDMLFKQQNDWVMKNTTETLTRIGKQAGLSQQAVEDCLKDQALLDKIAADQKFASRRAEGQFDADLFHQWRDDQGRDLVRGIRQEDQVAAEELILRHPRPGSIAPDASPAKALQKPWEKPGAAVALRPRPRHCRGHRSRKKRLAHTPTLPSMVLSRQRDSRPANRESCP